MKLDRYQRHNLIDWFPTELVKKAHFAVIGCGAVGNEVEKNLALLGVGKISLFDFDTVEIHNLTRSVLFRESDVGRRKVEVSAERLLELDPNISVTPYHGDFWDTLDFEQLSTFNGLICCVDNFEARLKLNNLCRIASVNFINTGIDSKYSVVEVFPFSQRSGVACYECTFPDSAYERIQKRYSCGWLKRAAFVEKKIPTTVITSSISGAIATSYALNLLRGNNSTVSKRILTDSFTGTSSISLLEKSCNCPSCAAYSKPIQVVSAKNMLSAHLFNEWPFPESVSISTSDPILVSYRCTNCTPQESGATIVFQRASEFDTTITICQKCGEDSVYVEIYDAFSMSDLLSRFPDQMIPAKYIQCETESEIIVINLEK